MVETVRSFWLTRPGRGEIRCEPLPDPGADEVLVRARHSAVSRGTEILVFRGRVQQSEYSAMRAPHQAGEFPGPVKYGYLSVGTVESGPARLMGRLVFCLYPHQSAYVVPATAVLPVPAEVPPERALLAGTMETAVNALWDAGPLVGDRISVIGAGMVGCCVARLAARIPGAQVTLVDVDVDRAPVAAALEVGFALPPDAPQSCDLVIHTSATAAGLQLALNTSAAGTTVLDLSWYGEEVTLSLGGRYHSQRLGLRASQVGTVAPARRGSRTPRDRLELALALLRDDALDVLLTSRSSLDELPAVLAAMADGRHPGLVHVVDYAG